MSGYQAIDNLGTNQFSEAINLAFKVGNSMGRYVAVYALAAQWGRTDPQAALAFAQTLNIRPNAIR